MILILLEIKKRHITKVLFPMSFSKLLYYIEEGGGGYKGRGNFFLENIYRFD